MENIRVPQPLRSVTLANGAPTTLEWKGRRVDPNAPWIIVAVEDNNTSRRHELFQN
jgi:hypothetical protein